MSELIYYRNLDEQLLVFPIKGDPTGIELKYVKSISLVTELIPIPRSPHYILGIVNIDGNIYPVIDLDILLTGHVNPDLVSPIISLIDIGETTFGIHTHNLPQVIPGTAKDSKGKSESVPKEWILGFTEHQEIGKLPIIDPKKFWVGMGESEVVGPSLDMEVTPKDIYQEDSLSHVEGMQDLAEAYEEEPVEEEKELDPEQEAAIKEAEALAKEVEEAEEEEAKKAKEAAIKEAEAMAEEVDSTQGLEEDLEEEEE